MVATPLDYKGIQYNVLTLLNTYIPFPAASVADLVYSCTMHNISLKLTRLNNVRKKTKRHPIQL